MSDGGQVVYYCLDSNDPNGNLKAIVSSATACVNMLPRGLPCHLTLTRDIHVANGANQLGPVLQRHLFAAVSPPVVVPIWRSSTRDGTKNQKGSSRHNSKSYQNQGILLLRPISIHSVTHRCSTIVVKKLPSTMPRLVQVSRSV